MNFNTSLIIILVHLEQLIDCNYRHCAQARFILQYLY